MGQMMPISLAVVDTTVLIHLLRGDAIAAQWLATQPRLAMTSISWLEVMQGAPGKRGEIRSLNLFRQFDLIYLDEADQIWAMQQLLTHRLSHGVSTMDCLIASVCHRLQVPLYTHNLRDMVRLLGSDLVVKPY
jgi:predicted nucleic acid-binding protein